MRRRYRWGIAFLVSVAIIVMMNNWFVRSMIYPAPPVPVPEYPPANFKQPDWNLDIHGWLYEPGKPASNQILLYFHGNGENLETLRQSGLLEELQQLQIPFLVVDYPGYGRSKGKASEQSILHNSLEAANWFKNRFHDRMLILCGWSLGASVAVQTAAKMNRADALIAMSPWTSLRDVAALHFSEWFVGFALQERYDALQAANTIKLPALIIHGELDDLIPAAQGKRVADAIQTPARWVPLPSVGHNDLLSQKVVWKEIADFLDQLNKVVRTSRPPGM